MPLAPTPANIEQTDFSAGWTPDLEESSLPPSALLDSINLIIERPTGAAVTREGYLRLPNFALQGYVVKRIYPYTLPGATPAYYLIIIATNKLTTANNIQVWAYNLLTQTAAAVSPSGKVWQDNSGDQWGAAVYGTFYGGSKLDKMWSWNPTDGWDSDPSTPTYDAWVADKAYKKNDAVLYTDGKVYSAADTNRFDTWESGTHYDKGDKVSVYISASGYWKSYKAYKGHDSDNTNKPGTGSGYWRLVKLQAPLIKDAENSEDIESGAWEEIPPAPITNVANYHAHRLWARYDQENFQYAIYSPQAANTGVAKLTWDATDWRITGEFAAGYVPFTTKRGDEITAFHSFGHYQLVFKRHSLHVVAGESPKSWDVTQLADVGCVGPKSITEHDGTVYFASDQGLYITDATQAIPCPGFENIAEWWRDALDWEESLGAVKIWSARGYVWISLATGPEQVPDTTLVYDPATQSFMKQSFGVEDAAVTHMAGIDQMFFAKPNKTGTFAPATYAWTGGIHFSASTQTIGATTTTNLFPNPGFEYAVISWYSPDDAVKVPDAAAQWSKTAADVTLGREHTFDIVYLKGRVVPGASRRGINGLEITHRDVADDGIVSPGDNQYEGYTQSFADVDTSSHTISAFVRRSDWHKNKTAPPIKFVVGTTQIAPTVQDERGHGWWRMSATYTGSLTSRPHGVVVKRGRTVEVDQAMANKGSLIPWFDGWGGDSDTGGAEGGGKGLVMQYDHPDADHMDDGGEPTYRGIPIPWFVRTAWFSFGPVREDRTLRRIWAMIRATDAMPYLRVFHDFSPEELYTEEGAQDETAEVSFFEAPAVELVQNALQFEFGATEAPGAALGIGAETIFLRRRYYN